MSEKIGTKLYRAIDAKQLTKVLAILSEKPELVHECIARRSVLHMAAECDFPELVDKLVELGCSPDVLDRDGYTPIYFPCSEGYLKVVEALLDKGADIDGLKKAGPNGHIDQTTPLVRAVRNGHADVVKLLLERGASLKVKDPKPLIERSKKFPEIEKLLIEANLDL